MELIFLFLLVVGIGIFVFLSASQASSGSLQRSPYRLKKQLLNASERQLYRRLLSVLPPETTLLSMVRVADVIEPAIQRSRNWSGWQTAFNAIQAKHFDFVVCRGSEMKVIAAIELDGPTHQRLQRRKRDQLLENVCKSAMVPLIRIVAGSPAAKNTEDLRRALSPIRV